MAFSANSCKQPDTNKTVSPSPPVKPLEEEFYFPSNLDTFNIPYNFFKRKNAELIATGERLASVEVLKTLFPGIYFKDYSYMEEANVVIWTCETCPPIAYEEGLINRLDTIPHGFLNFTQCIGSLLYCENDVKKEVFFFNTGSDLPGSGRFSFGVLGAAIFEENKGKWQLQDFTPVVCGEGRFSRADAPDTILQFGNQTFFSLKGGMAEGAGASYIYVPQHLFSLHQGHLQRLFLDIFSNCTSYDTRLTHWASNVQFVPSNKEFPDVLLVTNGYFELNNDNDEYQFWNNEIDWWPGLMNFLGKDIPCKFVVKRQFRYDGKSYKMANCQYFK
jgi:hypothetical protein